MPRPPILLITRPLPQARRFAAEAAAACPPHEALIAPLSEVVGLPFDPAVFVGAAGLVLTSANAIPFLPPLPPLPAWCVGPATARAAARAGFLPHEAGGDAVALLALLEAERPAGRLVHAHGRHLARQVAGAVPGVEVAGVALYEARALSLPEGLLPPDRRIVAPLFSPRAAAALGRQPGILALPDLLPVVISPAARNALPDPLATRALIAAAPDGGAMLRVVTDALSQNASAG
ncbi:uroporphyrinogen-III synthase [Pararhodobacter sp.]|uniref:uroporphyrinogen-III synthase n=1 Tax=Pararhodobacter sp. TaxID=2127056 RepID=UPI002FE37813